MPFAPNQVIDWESWRVFVNQPQAVRPHVPSSAEWNATTVSQRKESRAIRRRYHVMAPRIKTTLMEEIVEDVLGSAWEGLYAPQGVRPGFVLDGLGTVGKTTMVMELGRRYEQSFRARYKLSPTDNANFSLLLPVCYVTLPGRVTIQQVNALFMSYYGVVLPKKSDETSMTLAIANEAKRCATSLIIVDDIHFLRMKNRSAVDVNNHIKSMASRIGATFVYAGIDLDHSGLFNEGLSQSDKHASQTSHRFTPYYVRPFTDETDMAFLDVLHGFEDMLCLVNHQKGDLVSKAKTIHKLTNGFFGAISRLILRASAAAINDGAERIESKHLNAVTLDHAAQQHQISLGLRKAPAKTTSIGTTRQRKKKQ